MENTGGPGRTLGAILFFVIAFLLASYFVFSAVQGEYGVFRRAEITALERDLEARLAALDSEVAAMENKTRRLSDAYLDLDLLDERARKVLGMARADEIVIR